MEWRGSCETQEVGMKGWMFEDGLERRSAWRGHVRQATGKFDEKGDSYSSGRVYLLEW